MGGLSRKTLPREINNLAKELRTKLISEISGTIQSLMFDGGKDISGRKIIAFGLMNGSTVFLFKIVDTKQNILDETWYESTISAVIEELEKNWVFVPALIQNNEAAPLSGSLAVRASCYPHILIFRCVVHTLELLQENIISSHTCLVSVAKSVRKLAKIVRAHKFWRSLLEKTQLLTSAGDVPLKLVVHSNTRKWSSTYLVLERTLRLKSAVTCLLAVGPEKIPSDVPLLPNLDWKAMQQVRDILFQFYIREQILQQNGANVIEAVYLWKSIKECVKRHIKVMNYVNFL